MWMTTGFSRLPDGTAMMAACTDLNGALPSAATNKLVCADKFAAQKSAAAA